MIITLTTIPPRFQHLGGIFSALEAQTLRPDAVELYVPRQYRRFPGLRPDLPALPDWVTLIEIDEDHGPATKILPAAKRWRGKKVDLLFCDDDQAYDPQWASRFAKMRQYHPQAAVCEYGASLLAVGGVQRQSPPLPHVQRMIPTEAELASGKVPLGPGGNPLQYFRKPGYASVLFGFRGAMIRPGWLDDRAFAIPEVLWTVDDVWLSGMLELTGHKIWVGTGGRRNVSRTEVGNIAPLVHHVEDGHDRSAANKRCVAYLRETFGIWP